MYAADSQEKPGETSIGNRDILRGYIAFEGLDGAGTTTQLRNLYETLRRHGREVVASSEPTDFPIGKVIRAYLSGSEHVPPEGMALLFAADRLEHRARLIEPSIERGALVLADRCVVSSLAYQSVESGRDFVVSANARCAWPEHLIYLDVPVETCLRRLEGRASREIYEQEHTLIAVKQRYEEILDELDAEQEVSVLRIDGTQDPAAITTLIAESLLPKI